MHRYSRKLNEWKCNWIFLRIPLQKVFVQWKDSCSISPKSIYQHLYLSHFVRTTNRGVLHFKCESPKLNYMCTSNYLKLITLSSSPQGVSIQMRWSSSIHTLWYSCPINVFVISAHKRVIAGDLSILCATDIRQETLSTELLTMGISATNEEWGTI